MLETIHFGELGKNIIVVKTTNGRMYHLYNIHRIERCYQDGSLTIQAFYNTESIADSYLIRNVTAIEIDFGL